MSELTTIYLARHAQSALNNQKRISGQLDAPLSAKGAAQARALVRLLADAPLAAIYTSALQRSVHTALPLAQTLGMAVTPLAALNEINMGVLQGRWRDARDAEAAALWRQWQSDMWNFRAPGGESFAQLQHRVARALEQIRAAHSGATALIVAHRGTNRVLLGTLLQLPEEQWPGLKPSNKIVHRITLRDDRAVEHIELALRTKESEH